MILKLTKKQKITHFGNENKKNPEKQLLIYWKNLKIYVNLN